MTTVRQMTAQLSFLGAGAFRGSGLKWDKHRVRQGDGPAFEWELCDLLARHCS